LKLDVDFFKKLSQGDHKTCQTITAVGVKHAVITPGVTGNKTRIIEAGPDPNPNPLPTQGETKDICIVPPNSEQSQPP
jgi:hypothetical protein